MVVRIITLLVAVAMMTAVAAQGDDPSDDTLRAVDDSPDLDTPIMPSAAIVPLPPVQPVPPHAPLRVSQGRTHVLDVFRPPRLVASR